jgi:succinoglycan biosynthesis transport protein ExoP
LRTRNLPELGYDGSSQSAIPVIPAQYIQSTLSWAQIAAILRARRRQTLLISFAVLAAALLIIKLLPKAYTADATVLVNFESNENVRGAPAELYDSYLSTQVDLLQSRESIMSAIDKLGLTNDPEFTKGFKTNGVATLRDWVEKTLRADLSVQQTKGTQLIHVSVTSRDRDKAARIANAIVETYQARQSNHSEDPSNRSAEYAGQLSDLKDKVTAAEQRMSEFRQRTGITDVNTGINGQFDLGSQTLAQLEQQLLAAGNARRTAETRVTGDQNVSDPVLASQVVQNLKNQLSTQQAQLADASSTLGPRHPRVVELQSQIDSTRQALRREIATVSQNGTGDVGSSKQLEAKLEHAVDEQRAKLVKIRQLQDEGQKLELELQSAQTVYKRALDSSDQSLFASTALVGRANPPLEPTKPNKIMLAVGGLLLALIAGVLGPLGYEMRFNRRLHCRDDIERNLGLPVLAEFDRSAIYAGAT